MNTMQVLYNEQSSVPIRAGIMGICAKDPGMDQVKGADRELVTECIQQDEKGDTFVFGCTEKLDLSSCPVWKSKTQL